MAGGDCCKCLLLLVGEFLGRRNVELKNSRDGVRPETITIPDVLISISRFLYLYHDFCQSFCCVTSAVSWGFSTCSGLSSFHDCDWSQGCWDSSQGCWDCLHGFMALIILSNKFHILKLLNKSDFLFRLILCATMCFRQFLAGTLLQRWGCFRTNCGMSRNIEVWKAKKALRRIRLWPAVSGLNRINNGWHHLSEWFSQKSGWACPRIIGWQLQFGHRCSRCSGRQ